MKFSLATGFGAAALLLLSVDASSKYRSPRSSGSRSSSVRGGASSQSRPCRIRSAVHRDDYDDDDFHRSLSSSTTWEGGSDYSSSLSLNDDNWDMEESYSPSSFYDFEDVKQNRKKKKRKSNALDETERILLALERSSREEEDGLERFKSSKRKRRRRRKGNDISSSSLSSLPFPSKSSKKKRRKRKVAEPKTQGLNAPSRNSKNISRSKEMPMAKKAFVSRTASATRKPPAATAGNIGSSSSPSSGGNRAAGRQTPQPKSHPDRTTWEVPSYSHKISTMMSNKNNESKSKSAPRRTTATALPRATRATTNPSSGIGGRIGSTARTTASTTRSTRVTKLPTAATPAQASTLGSTTTPWVRTFLAGRPKDRLLPLPKDYISDNFNLAQLPPVVERIGYQAMGDDAIPVAKALQQHRMTAATSGESPQPTRSSSYPIYRRALHMILADADASTDDESSDDEDLIIPPYAIQKAAEALYLLLHARFVISPRGLEAIRHVMALDNTVFGKCPRSCCKGTGLLPYGYSNDYTSDASVPTVTTASRKEHDSCCHRYCPSCGEVWISWESKTDGCAWGPSWCHLFLLAFGSQVYAEELEAAAAASQATHLEQPKASPAVRAFLHRTRATTVTNSSSGSDRSTASEDLSRPTPSVFGFQIHPATSFGRPFNEASLRGGSND